MKKTVVCLSLVAAFVMTPVTAAHAAMADSDSSCARGMTLNFCGSYYRATRIAVASTALAGATLLMVRAKESEQPCPPLNVPTTTTPEPATIALVGTGMLAIATRRISRRRHALRSP
jgi:ammonia channel protein AmtB